MHKHIIGLLAWIEESQLATSCDLAHKIIGDTEQNKWRKDVGYPCARIYNAKEYSDFRYSTDLTRFKYCPECGEKIDWKKVRIEIEEELEGRGYDEKN